MQYCSDKSISSSLAFEVSTELGIAVVSHPNLNDMASSFVPGPQPFVLDAGTIISLAIAFSCMPLAQLLTSYSLPKTTATKYKVLFGWTAYDFLTHFMVEASYLYHCFFSYIELPVPTADYPHPASLGGDYIQHLYGRSDRRYGPFYSSSATGRMWQEYAKADRRWGGADVTVISLEILTCCVAAPIEVYTCYLIYKYAKSLNGRTKAQTKALFWFLAIVTATAELYGGFMTFAPEWLSGSTQLDISNPIYLYLYLTFFNILWVFLPAWILYAGYDEVSKAFTSTLDASKKSK